MPFDSLSAGAFGLSSEPQRRSDGSVDYDHYRRLAAEIRAKAFAHGLASSAAALREAAVLANRSAMAVFGALAEWRERAKGRRVLASMDDRLRRDIGLSRFDVIRETSKPFWRA